MSKKWFTIIVCITFVITVFSGVSVGELNFLSRVNTGEEIKTCCHIVLNVDNATGVASILISEGFEVLYGTVTETSLELIVTPDEYRILESRGFEPVILSRGQPFYEIQAERQQNSLGQIPPGYLNLSEIVDEMYDVESVYPSICKVFDLTETYNISPTYEGRHIYAMKISDNISVDEDEPSFLMVSCHHAREIVTPVIALYAIDQFTENYGTDPDITDLVDEYEIWISPVWNPDGYEYCYYYDNWWRKNRRPPDGVDLNRNYPFGWYSGCSGSSDPYSQTYKGPNPASEPETQTMIAFTNDRHFAKVLDYHSYGEEVLYGYCCHSHPFSSFFYSEAVSLSSAAGYGYVRVPSAEGEHYEWQIVTNGSYANLMETHTTFQPSYSSALAEAAQVWPATIWMLDRPISISGHVKDSITNEPLVANITLEGVTFPNGEEFFSEPVFGRFHLFLPPDTYTVNFSRENYHSQSHEITITQSSAEVLEVELVRLNNPPNKPTISGEENGKVGEEYNYTFKATDPEQDDLEYYIDWGDDNVEEWIGPYESGEEITLNHSWQEEGDYTIKAKVRDVYGLESGWGYLHVTMPINKVQCFRLFYTIFQQNSLFKILMS